MDKKFAEELDLILKGGRDNAGSFEFISKQFAAQELGAVLKENKHGQWIRGDEFLISPDGYAFYSNGGYMKEFKATEEKEELRRLKINELEYKKKLRFWKIVSAILGATSAVLGILLGRCT